MWKLTVTRTTEREIFEKLSEVNDYIVLEFPSLREAHEYIIMTEQFGVGEFKFLLDYINEKKGEAEC